jgi:hypothetical protein
MALVTATAPAQAQGGGILLGGTPDYLGGPTNVADKVSLMEQDFGRKADVVRIWHGWDSNFPTPGEIRLRDSGHALLMTVRSDYKNRTQIPWRDIANAAPGSQRHNEMVDWARRIKNYGGKVYFNWQHEPELVKNQSFGNSSDYKRAFQKFVSIIRAQGATNVEFVWIMTSWAFHVPSSDYRQAAKWYPGDGYVDHIAADPFNWFGCRPGHNPKWQELAPQLAPFIAFGKQHPSKGLILAEVGSDEDSNNSGRKAQWIRNMRNLLKSNSQFTMVVWYNQKEPNHAACQWETDSSSQSLAAFREMAYDPYFNNANGQPGNNPPAPNPPAPNPPVANGSVTAPVSCWAARTGGRTFKVTWTKANGGNDGAVRYVVRRSRNNSQFWWAARTGSGPRQVWNTAGQRGTYKFTVEAHGANGAVSVKRACGGGGYVN